MSAKLLQTIERRFPSLAQVLRKRFTEWFVPANRSMGIRIVRIAPDSSDVVLRLRDRRRNRNYGGSVHGGVILALAESVHGVAVLWQFHPAVHSMVSKEVRLEFLKRARGELRTRFGLTEEMRRSIDRELRENRKCERELSSEVTNRAGEVVARLTATYYIRRYG